MQFNVNGQLLERTDKENPVGDTINYLTGKFIFDDEWTGFTKYVHMQQGKQVYEKQLVDDKVGMDVTGGKWIMWLHGTKDNVRITTNQIIVKIEDTGIIAGEPFPELYKSLTEEIIEKVNNLSGQNEEAIRNSVSAYLAENPVEGVTEEQVQSVVSTYLVENPVSATVGAGSITETELSTEVKQKLNSTASGGNQGTTEATAVNGMYFIGEDGATYKLSVDGSGNVKLINVELDGLTDLASGRILAWHDEFDYATLDKTLYQPEMGKVRGSANMWFCDDEEYLYIQDSVLHIKGKKDSKYAATQGSNYTYTGAGVTTQGAWDFHYGLIEFKAKIPRDLGAWPALWTCGQGFHKVYTIPTNTVDGSYWATQHGEIDIAEKLASLNGQFQSAIWYKTDGYGTDVPRKGGQFALTSFDDDWHIIGMEWTSSKLITYLDRVKLGEVTISSTPQFQMPMQLLMGVGVDIAKGQPTEMDLQVDWIRYYLPSDKTSKVLAPTSITVSETDVTLEVDGFYDFFPTYAPDGQIANYAYTGASSDTSVATVAGGRITAKGYGTCTVTITSVADSTVNATINVSIPEPVPTTMFTFDTTEMTFTDTTAQQVAYSRLPSNCTDTITWSSDDATVATVNSTGLVTPTGNGTCTITATSGIYSPTINVTVSGINEDTPTTATFTLNGATNPDLSTFTVTHSANTSNASSCVVEYDTDNLLHVKNVPASGYDGFSVSFLQLKSLSPAGKTIMEIKCKIKNDISTSILEERMRNARIGFDNGTAGIYVTVQPTYGLRVLTGTNTENASGDTSYGTIASETYFNLKLIVDYNNLSAGGELYLNDTLVHTLTQAELNTASTSNKNCPNIIITDADMWVESINFTTNN